MEMIDYFDPFYEYTPAKLTLRQYCEAFMPELEDTLKIKLSSLLPRYNSLNQLIIARRKEVKNNLKPLLLKNKVPREDWTVTFKLIWFRELMEEKRRFAELKAELENISKAQDLVESIKAGRIYLDLEQANNHDIVDLFPNSLHKRGKTYVGVCPFHDEKTGSFTIYTASNSFYCFGCHEHGTAVMFYKKLHDCTYKEAIKALV